LKKFSLSLIGIFIPIYIIQRGFAVPYLFLYLAVSGLVGVSISILAAKLISKVDCRWGLALSYVFYIPSLLLLRYLQLDVFLIVLISALYVLGTIFHNISLNTEFTLDSHRKRISEEAGMLLGLPNIAMTIAPFLGGFIMTFYSFDLLITASLILALASIFPLLISQRYCLEFNFSLSDVFAENHKNLIPLFLIRGIQGVSALFFVIFVFQYVGGTLNAGAVRSLNIVGFVIAALLAGHLTMKYGKRRVLIWSAGLLALTYFLRGFVGGPFQALIISLVAGISFKFYHIPIYSIFVGEAKSENQLEFFSFKRTFASLGKIITVILVLSVYFSQGFRTALITSFFIGGISSLLAIYFTRNSTE
jgi:predicted MFS family arabinose efflux permease